MATQKSVRARRKWLAGLVVVAALLAAAWFTWGPGLRGDAIAGAAYGAHVACSCRFIEGRPLKQCENDKLAGMGMVRFSEDDAAKSVTASVPLLASDTATYKPGYGCLLKPWEGDPVG
ncbi:hypothetical protein [Qipengyuania algicida]|uniref:hypothetical protein n=1 Tax=Qipengyuania algicida TaxID=1836209 RepID=UPI001F303A22|nr:hypothetical protein [Qipengyuania algicida]